MNKIRVDILLYMIDDVSVDTTYSSHLQSLYILKFLVITTYLTGPYWVTCFELSSYIER